MLLSSQTVVVDSCVSTQRMTIRRDHHVVDTVVSLLAIVVIILVLKSAPIIFLKNVLAC